MDLNDAGPDNLLVTVKDVLDIVKDQPLTTKELLMGLKSRVSAHKDNKLRIISIVKQNLRLVDGKLVLKTNSIEITNDSVSEIEQEENGIYKSQK